MASHPPLLLTTTAIAAATAAITPTTTTAERGVHRGHFGLSFKTEDTSRGTDPFRSGRLVVLRAGTVSRWRFGLRELEE